MEEYKPPHTNKKSVREIINIAELFPDIYVTDEDRVESAPA